MEKNAYHKLKQIKLDKSGVINCDLNDSIYKFCKANNIDNLGDFVDCYNNKRNTINDNDLYYFDGIVDYINYVFLNIKLTNFKYLNDIIRIIKNKGSYKFYAYIENKKLDTSQNKVASLKRLGFNNKEILYILGRVLYLDKCVSIIDAIGFILNSFDIKNMNLEDEIFLNKLFVLSYYYEKHKDEIDNDKVYEVKEYIKNLKKMWYECSMINKEFNYMSYQLEKKLSELPQNREDVKKLVKDYQSFICNIK